MVVIVATVGMVVAAMAVMIVTVGMVGMVATVTTVGMAGTVEGHGVSRRMRSLPRIDLSRGWRLPPVTHPVTETSPPAEIRE